MKVAFVCEKVIKKRFLFPKFCLKSLFELLIFEFVSKFLSLLLVFEKREKKWRSKECEKKVQRVIGQELAWVALINKN